MYRYDPEPLFVASEHPSSTYLPEVGSKNPVSIFITVVLPAPFCPKSPTMLPC